MLEADLRNLSAEARKSDTGFAGYFTGSQHPEVKEAAERALLKLRSLPAENLDGPGVAECEEVWRAFIKACEAKNVRLSAIGLACLQKLVANEAIAQDAIPEVLSTLRQHADVYDEAVQLKTLQTVLSLLQSKLYPKEEEGVAAMLGICFRLLGSTRCADSVHTTAAATLRQAVALIFDRIVTCEGLANHPSPQAMGITDMDEPFADAHSATKAGLLLFNDLCALASGQPAPWLQVPPLPKAFALDMLEFVLSHHAIVFTALPNFERLLGGRLASLLMTSLRAGSTMEDEAAEMVERRLLMRTVSTVVKQFGHVLVTECEIYLTVLVKSLEQDFPLWHRIFVLEVLRILCGDADLMRFLFETYDMTKGTSFVVRDVIIVLARHVHSALQMGDGLDEILGHMAMLFGQKAQGVEWTPDLELLLVGGPLPEAFAVAMATDGLLAVTDALSKLADKATTAGELHSDPPPPAPAPAEGADAEAVQEEVSRDLMIAAREVNVKDPVAAAQLANVVQSMVSTLWEILLLPLSILLARANGEALVLDLLKGYQSFTQTCGILDVADARDAFLASLCDFTLSQRAENQHPRLPSGEASPGAAPGSFPSPTPPVPGLERPPREEERAEGLLLSTKNVHALRTLFNIAHRLAGNLGPSWVLVLETLSQLERALNNPHTTTQEASAGHGGPPGAVPSDLSILTAAAAQLFQATVMLDDTAVNSLLSALRDVSAKAARSMGGQPGAALPGGGALAGAPPARLFALQRMVDVVLHNTQRMASLWPVMCDHLTEVLQHENAPVRGAALERVGEHLSLGWTPIIGMLHNVASKVSPHTPLRAPPCPQPAQCTLLRPLTPPHSHRATTALPATFLWPRPRVLWISCAVQETPDLEPHCDPVVSRHVVSMVAAYGAQPSDLNISLAAIGLMWNMADFFGKSIQSLLLSAKRGAGDTEGASDEPTEEEEQAVVLAPAETAAHAGLHAKAAMIAELLLLPLFTSLQALCSDLRPEVRNSGLRTLLSTLVSHGGKLPPSLWRRCLWEILFPLLDTVRALAAGSSKEESVGTQLGREKGRAVMMLVHHSRNTEQKQWDETLVLSLNGTGRLLRTYMPVLTTLEGFDARWDSFLSFFEGSVIEGSKEVAVAAISALTAILQGHAGTQALPRPLWKRAIRAYASVTRSACAHDSHVQIKSRVELITALTRLYTARRTAFDEADVRALLSLLDQLARAPFSHTEKSASAMLSTMALPPVQRTVLDLVTQLAPFEDRHVRAGLWGTLVHLLLAYLPGEPPPAASNTRTSNMNSVEDVYTRPGDEAQASDSNIAGALAKAAIESCPVTGEKVETMPGALSALFAEHACSALLQIFKEHMPTETRAQLFAPVLFALEKCLATRLAHPQGNLWRTAAQVFVTVVRVGLPAVNMYRAGAGASTIQSRDEMLTSMGIAKGDGAHPDDVWEALCGAFERLLLPGSNVHQAAVSTEVDPEQRRADDELELAALDTLCDVVLTSCGASPDNLRRRLVAIVDCGVDRPIPPEGYSGGERFSHVCLRKLYVLGMRGGEAEGPHACLLAISRHAMPILLNRCEQVVRAYAQDDHPASNQNIPRSRFDEMM
ncbi:hypothetical protein CYMTET_53172 [Cymbomonas tetramitiformis]|uniref:Protein MON2 homolog n=1 Tax=Cymbomonas tetramitiformis TaxID=36881 RepID=A0AAE0BJ98_9CHLO|nr:hypothetical protein CYMTET_53172 [Cymbomonas tetramitiformis]